MFTTLLTAVAVLLQPPVQPQPLPGQFVPGQPINQPPTVNNQPVATQPATTSLDGTWTVLAFEKNGKMMQDMANKTVTVKNGIATFNNDKNKQMRLQFGPNGTLQVADVSNETTTPPAAAVPGGVVQYSPQQSMKTGVYIMTDKYFSVTLHNTGMMPPQPVALGAAPQQQKAYMTLFLKRTSGGSTTTNEEK